MTTLSHRLYSKVCKEECVWSFARPTSADGLNVGLTTFHGVGQP